MVLRKVLRLALCALAVAGPEQTGLVDMLVDPPLIHRGPIECAACKDIAKDAKTLAANKPSLAHAIASLEKVLAIPFQKAGCAP